MTSHNQSHESAAFEQERARFVGEITQELSQLISNVNLLNRNLETIITIGHDFEQLSQLWQSFHTSPYQEQLQQELLRLEETEGSVAPAVHEQASLADGK